MGGVCADDTDDNIADGTVPTSDPGVCITAVEPRSFRPPSASHEKWNSGISSDRSSSVISHATVLIPLASSPRIGVDGECDMMASVMVDGQKSLLL